MVPVGGRVPLVTGPQQHEQDVVATLVPQGWEVGAAGPDSLTLVDPGDRGAARRGAGRAGRRARPCCRGSATSSGSRAAWASYYLVDTSGGTARPTMVLELTYGSWAQVSASPALGWGMPELTAFAAALRAPFTCADPCEVPLAP